MKNTELELRKELALTRIKIARTELALRRAHKPRNSLATASAAVDLAGTVLDNPALGAWARYGRLAALVARILLGARQAV